MGVYGVSGGGVLLLAALVALSGCKDGGGDGGGGTPSYTVEGVASPGGAITPNSQTVTEGETASLIVTPDPTYRIDSVSGCGGSLSGDTWTTGVINSDCTVNASFSLKEYSVSVIADTDGSVTPLNQTVTHGNSSSISVTPDPAYAIDGVSGCGISSTGKQYETTSFDTGAITGDCTITVNFLYDLNPPSIDALAWPGSAWLWWYRPRAAEGFNLYYGTSSGIDPTDSSTWDQKMEGVSNPWQVTGLGNNLPTYYFVVTSTAGVHESTASGEVRVHPGDIPQMSYVSDTDDGRILTYAHPLDHEYPHGRLKFYEATDIGIMPNEILLHRDPSNNRAGLVILDKATGYLDWREIASDGSLVQDTGFYGPHDLLEGGSGQVTDIAMTATQRLLLATISGEDVVRLFDFEIAPDLYPEGSFPTGPDPRSLTLHPNQRFVYTVNAGDGSISQFRIRYEPDFLLRVDLAPLTPASVPAPGNIVAFVIEPNGQYAYALDQQSDRVLQYHVTDGVLSPMAETSVSTGATPLTMLATDSGVYVTSESDSAIYQYDIDTDGTLVPKTVASVSTGAAVNELKLDPAGKYLYALADAEGRLYQYEIDSVSGSLTPLNVPSIPADVDFGSMVTFFQRWPTEWVSRFGFALEADGFVGQYEFDEYGQGPYELSHSQVHTESASVELIVRRGFRNAYIASGGALRQYEVTPDGALLPLAIAEVGTGTNPEALAQHPDGRFVYAAGGVGEVNTWVADTPGELTLASTASTGGSGIPRAITVDPSGRFAYVTNTDDNNIAQFSINNQTGSLTPLSPATVSAGSAPHDIVIEASGRYLYAAYGDQVVDVFAIGDDGTLLEQDFWYEVSGLDWDDEARVGALGVHPTGTHLYIASTYTDSYDGLDYAQIETLRIQSDGSLIDETRYGSTEQLGEGIASCLDLSDAGDSGQICVDDPSGSGGRFVAFHMGFSGGWGPRRPEMSAAEVIQRGSRPVDFDTTSRPKNLTVRQPAR